MKVTTKDGILYTLAEVLFFTDENSTVNNKHLKCKKIRLQVICQNSQETPLPHSFSKYKATGLQLTNLSKKTDSSKGVFT